MRHVMPGTNLKKNKKKNILNAWSTLRADRASGIWHQDEIQTHLVEVNILHPDVLHHGRLLVDVGCDDAESGASLSEHT